MVGLALTQHRNSLLLRRTAKDSKALGAAIRAVGYGRWKHVGFGGELRTPDGREVEVGGCQHEDDKEGYQGQPHDLIAFDELPQFTRSQYEFIIGWNRPANPRRYPNLRCRVVGAGNPPTDPGGEWVFDRWRAWLAPTAGAKAAPGELRWYTTVAGKEEECPDGRPLVHKGLTYAPRSRTFIPARLEDNPDLLKTGYAATLEAMPEPLRSMLRFGDMAAARQDDRWQVIPSRWVALAQRRWAARVTEGGARPDASPDCVGVDVAMAQTPGGDRTALAPRTGATIGGLVTRPGSQTPDGQSVLALLTAAGWAGSPCNVDAIGIGKSVIDTAAMVPMPLVRPVVVSNATDWVDPKFPWVRFANTRAAVWWNLRTLLDPEAGPEDTRLAVPPDPGLLSDLTAPRYCLRLGGIAVESKDDIRKRIGRSTDVGDAVGLACWLPPAGPESYAADYGATPFDRLPGDIFR